jgi:hypothetical protein
MGGEVPARRKGRGCISQLLLVGVFGLVVLYGVVAITSPWAFHIGGRWTPFLNWHGYGQLLTRGGVEYPLYVSFYPASRFSHLHLEGLRPTGGLQGSGWLCTSPGVTQRLNLSGTIYGGWRSTDGSLMGVRLLEPRIIDVGQGHGFFDLTGRWQGPKLVMDDRGHVPAPFRSGLRIEHASVTLGWGTYSEFKDLCAKTAAHAANR